LTILVCNRYRLVQPNKALEIIAIEAKCRPITCFNVMKENSAGVTRSLAVKGDLLSTGTSGNSDDVKVDRHHVEISVISAKSLTVGTSRLEKRVLIVHVVGTGTRGKRENEVVGRVGDESAPSVANLEISGLTILQAKSTLEVIGAVQGVQAVYRTVAVRSIGISGSTIGIDSRIQSTLNLVQTRTSAIRFRIILRVEASNTRRGRAETI